MPPKLKIDEAKAALLNLLQKKSVFHGDFTLSSGAKSNYYIDCRLTTFDPEGAWLVGQWMYSQWAKDASPLQVFSVRKSPKAHGQTKLIEGNFKKSDTVVVIDDVVTR